jgi:SAM-dependent methyltransferase
MDEERDGLFYDAPRFVQHIDEGAIAAVTATIRRHVPPGASVLDLMSSWVSHLPPRAELTLRRVAGLGMNADELAENPRLDEWTVHDLNRDPRLPYPDASFDATLITVSIQYLTRPAPVLREVARVLRPGGVVIVSFSNRMFATKAVRIWQETPEAARPGLVIRYLALAGGFAEPTVEAHLPSRRWSGAGDPLWAVVTQRVGVAPGMAPGGMIRRDNAPGRLNLETDAWMLRRPTGDGRIARAA